MKVSIVIPVYNEEKDIRKCLESLSMQTFGDFEVLVIDDGSKDKTLQVLSNFKFKNNSLKILKQNHLGAGAARNFGANKAKGEILIFIDADMTFDPNFLGKLIMPILDHNAIGTFSKEEFLDNKDNLWARCWNLNRGLPPDRMHSSNYPVRQKVFRAILKEKFIEVGGFDPRGGYTDDYSLSDRLGEMALAAEGAVFYHSNPGTLSEIYIQSKWMAKRKYKLGLFGIIFTLFKYSLPVSIIIGIYKSFILHTPFFIFFKLISDMGQFIGIIEYLNGKVSK